MRTSEVMAVGIAKDADVTTAAHVRTREVCMSHLLHLLKISYVFTSQDEHNASLFIDLTKTSKHPERCHSVNDIANLQIIFESASDLRKFFCCCR